MWLLKEMVLNDWLSSSLEAWGGNMDRRQLVAGLGLAGAVAPLLVATEALAKPAGNGLAAYREGTLTISTISRRASELALKQGSPQVQSFAKLEMAEQMTVGQTLLNKENPPLMKLGAEDSDALAKLATLSGAQFDQAYVAAEIAGHKKLLGIQEALIAKGGLGSDASHIAYFLRTFIHEHLELLAQLQKA
ncbi:MAG: DUF4142 domain-containing protein [Pseudomonadota bacterium]|nr:DUF4142 domain-containing protein [Hyphomicrobiales bacterium]